MAYRNTVMDVSHDEAVYEELLDENVVVEFALGSPNSFDSRVASHSRTSTRMHCLLPPSDVHRSG